ncbi:MAG: division/cell wall cluster transcriptional repressor MraZ [Bifidobacteriaceae bacterium]|jgi:MraZ protein|nr:division/cell wall cluster transcriptional repressor MraZ [Bifidobacteriaceae bacterium]
MAAGAGEYSLKLDDKGRIILPAKVRPALASGAHLTRGQDHCLFLFSEAQFDAHRESMAEATPPGMPAVAFDRIFYSSVVTTDVDKQGRLNIPPALRAYAELERDLVVIVLATRMEIWSAAGWAAYLERYESAYASLSEGVR